MEKLRIESDAAQRRYLSKKIQLVHYIFIALLTVNIIVWVLLTLFAIYELALSANNGASLSQGIINLAAVLSTGVLLTLLLRVISLVLKDIAKGSSPFAASQSKRIKMLALLLFLYGVFDFFLASNYSSGTVFGGLDGFGFGHTNNIDNPSEGMTLTINITSFVTAIIVYSLSLIFEYGSELQNTSDSFL